MERTGAAAETVRFEFTGSAIEYFRIWIVNVLLTIITLGVYSAWAKVRTNRYLYSSTRLAGASFEYLAQPLQILKGRLIAVGLLAIYVASQYISPVLQLVEMLLFLAFLPWLAIRARAFTLRNSAYRNISFGFRAGYGEAAGIYILWPILLGLSLGILYPLYVWRRAKFAIDGSSFGLHAFAFTAGKGSFFATYLKFLLLLVVVLVAGAALIGAAFTSLGQEGGAAAGAAMLAVIVTVIALLATLSYVHVAVTNLIWSSIEIGGMSTRCTLATPMMFWIAFSSMIAVMLSFGLLIPWATIRMARYRVENMNLLNADNLPALLSAKPGDVGAAGEELSDLLGIDVAV